ncbi:MAG: type II secretion system protein GspG [Bdellovibrionales bacterium]
MGADSSEKPNKNKVFSSFDFITTFCAILAVLAFVGPLLYKNVESRSLAQAYQESMNLSKQLPSEILTNLKEARKNSGSRMPANAAKAPLWEGASASKDPWGNPYMYRMVRDSFGLPTHIVVWSKGPNGAQDTPDRDIASFDKTDSKFRMDDIGHRSKVY